ncbi:molybdate-binding protein [Microlunatus endophyticus]|uniref:Molybdate-binding protein n=2 Tax=Microlunatus endophyticus TaxID=1716077 RepID=A0A917W8K4_9ACTN|nr:molybdate-binding protein [Microlunatus endophyticus]
MKRWIRGPIAVIGLAGMVALAGCSGGTSDSGSGTTSGPTASGAASPSASGKISGDITVLAAASLTETFTTIGKNFEKAHPGTKVTFSFGSSATLATQVNQGAPADVFASADQKTMKLVTDAGNASGPTLFATNTLEIAVPPGNPAKVTGLKDFADSSKKTVLCAKQVPCGSAAQQVFTLAGITPKPVSYETDVKAALTKVEQNEADAALVYRTDVSSAGDKVQGVTFPEAQKVVNQYPIVALKESRNSATAAAFVGYVTGPGEQVLQQAGFGAP